MKTTVRWVRWYGAVCVLLLTSIISSFADDLVVRVMPDGIKTTTKNTAYAWAGNPLDVWGNVTWINSTSGTYEWNFGDGSSSTSTGVSDPRNISEIHAYAVAGTYYATLTVADGDGKLGSAQVRIDVLPVPDSQSQINLAIERGLKYLYLNQDLYGDPSNWPKGGWSSSYIKTDGAAQTALSVLAFENRGHLPISPVTDIYRETVINGLNFALWTINDIRTPPFTDNWQDPDVNGLGAIIGYYGTSDESFYPHGMLMMALAASGPYDTTHPPEDAVHNPALNLTVPDWVAQYWYNGSLPINGWTYYKVLQSMMEYAAWAQADPAYWTSDGDYTQRGGWRYVANSYDADNSVGQWPVIGLEAAEQWGIIAPAWVKSELKTYWLHHSYNSTLHGWGYSDAGLVEDAHDGAGLSMMAYVGIPKTDSWYQEALSGLADHWTDQNNLTWDGSDWWPWPTHFGPTTDSSGNAAYNSYNYYAMYGIAKACRIARDINGHISEVTQIGGHNWYDEYAAWLLQGQDTSGGQWNGWGYWPTDVATPFAILVLEPTVSSLRPVAAITASPNPVNAGSTVSFNIGGSTHQDTTKFLVSWKLIFDTTSGKTWSAPDASGSFPVSGPIPKTGGYPQKFADYDVTATVQVTDNSGETAEAVTTVHIIAGLVAPIANPGGPYFGRVNGSVTLDGSSSYSPNAGGSIVSYKWDLDGNGTYETDAGSSPTLAHTWTTPYSGQIGLKVTDNNGWVSTASVYTKIIVSDLKPVSYQLISYRRITRTVWEYTYKFTIKNQGNGDVSNVTATLQNWPSQVTVVDGNVDSFPSPVNPGDQATSTDTFTIRIDRTTPVANVDLTWRVTYTDIAGTYTLLNFPLY